MSAGVEADDLEADADAGVWDAAALSDSPTVVGATE